MSVALCGYKTWYITFREEHRLNVFENKVLEEYPTTIKMRGDWRNLHNDELYCLHGSSIIVRMILYRRFDVGRKCSQGGG